MRNGREGKREGRGERRLRNRSPPFSPLYRDNNTQSALHGGIFNPARCLSADTAFREKPRGDFKGVAPARLRRPYISLTHSCPELAPLREITIT